MLDDKDRRRSILVVDDFDDSRGMIAFRLRHAGYDVVEAANGRLAVEAVRRKCPDLVLMDLSLPVLDGLSATCRLRELEEMCDVPVVALTAHSEETHRNAAFAVGCDEYLTKPVDVESLMRLVKRMLPGGGAPARRAGRPRIQSESLADDQLADAIERYLPG